MARRFAEWSTDGTVEVVTHGPTSCYEVHVLHPHPGMLLGLLVGSVQKDVSQARTHEWVADSHGRRTFHPTLASALTAIANREASARQPA